MKRQIFGALILTLAVTAACKKNNAHEDHAGHEGHAAHGDGADDSAGMRMMHGTPAPDLAPGETRAFGEALADDAEAVSVHALLEQCLDEGDACVVEGKIGAACRSSGCWFTVTDDDVQALILVEMEDEAFTIPKNAAGTDAVLRGTLTRDTFSPSESFYYESEAARALGRPAPERGATPPEGYLLTIDAAVLTKAEES